MRTDQQAASRKGAKALGSKIELYHDGSVPLERASGRALSFDLVAELAGRASSRCLSMRAFCLLCLLFLVTCYVVGLDQQTSAFTGRSDGENAAGKDEQIGFMTTTTVGTTSAQALTSQAAVPNTFAHSGEPTRSDDYFNNWTWAEVKGILSEVAGFAQRADDGRGLREAATSELWCKSDLCEAVWMLFPSQEDLRRVMFALSLSLDIANENHWFAPLTNTRGFGFGTGTGLLGRRLKNEKPAHRSLGGRLLPGLQILGTFGAAVVFLITMMPGPREHRDHGPPRQHAHVGDAGPPYVGTATLKVPPAWSSERQSTYSLRSWISDLILWSSATDLDHRRLGPIAALQVTGIGPGAHP